MNVSPLGLSAAALPRRVPAQRVPVSSGQLLTACRLAWEQDGRLVALWASDERDRDRGFCVRVALAGRRRARRCSSTTLPDARRRTIRISRRSFPPPTGCSARRSTSSASPPTPTTSGHGHGWRAGRSTAFRCAATSRRRRSGSRARRTTRSSASRATACTRSRSGRCTPASSSPAISASRSSARRCCGSRSAWAYVHKGIEKRFESMSLADGHRLAGRVSGDSTVAYAWAYAQALEAIAGIAAPPRAAWLRALALERERIANHLGDLGYLGNDGGFAFGLAQFSRLKEDVLRTQSRGLRPPAADGLRRARRRRARSRPRARGAAARRVRGARARDRRPARHLRRARRAAGPLPHLRPRRARARRAARAHRPGRARERAGARPALRLPVRALRRAGGAQVATRQTATSPRASRSASTSSSESLRLVRTIVERCPTGDVACAPLPRRRRVPARPRATSKAGAARCWSRSKADPTGSIRRCHPHDPSWSNWPVLEHAVIGNIVPDFPLINKSFNLSYSGHDL